MDFEKPIHAKEQWSRTTRTLTLLGRRSASRAARAGKFRFDLGARSLWAEWKPLLSGKHLKDDIIAGLTVACIALPLSFAIALASGVKPEIGLISAIVAGFVCAIFGGTPLAVSGPAAAMSVLIAANVEEFGLGGLLVIGLGCGFLQLLTGVFGFGSLARFVPAPVIAGFTAGIGAIILIGQLPRALGLPPPDQSHVIEVIKHIGELIEHMKPMVFVLTLLTMTIMMRLPKLVPQLPAPLVAVLVPSAIVTAFSLDVPLIGEIPRSLPWPHLPELPADWTSLLGATVIVYALATLETLLSSSAVDKIARGSRHEPNQELIGQGLGNIAVSLFGGIPTTGVIARSALNVQAGAKSRRSSIIHSITLLLVVFVLAPIMSKIPIAALAGVLLSVAINMFHPAEFRSIWISSRSDAFIYMVTLAVVVFTDLIIGVQAGIGIALLIAAIRVGQTKIQVHRSTPVGPYRFSLSGPLGFMSTSRIDEVRAHLKEFNPLRGVVIDLSEIPHADTTGTKALMELIDTLERRGSRVVLKGAGEDIEQLLTSADLSVVPRKRFAYTEADVLELLEDNRQDAVRSRLLAGVERFSRDLHRKYEPLFERLGEGQKPHTLFITCSDSRITPNLLTATDPGELFIVRNVGNSVPEAGTDGVPAEGAAIEYAVGVLGVSQIIVCGHSKCGAIAACFADPSTLKDYPNVSLWLKDIREGLTDKFDGKNLDAAGRGNALRQLERVLTYPLVREGVESGKLRLSAWFFDVSKGVLSEWSPATDTFVTISSVEHEALEKAGAIAANARANKA